MANNIEVIGEEKLPTVICPYCKEEINIDITPFARNVSLIIDGRCYKCGGVIHTGLLILCDRHPQNLLNSIKKIISIVSSKNVKLKG